MKGAKLFGAVVLLMVTASVVAGLFIAGTPGKQRERRFDDQRASDLQQISSAVDQYALSYGALPVSLDDLVKPENARLYYLRSITDPETAVPYAYSVTGAKSYQLCVTFTQSSEELAKGTTSPAMMDPYAKAWEHPAGPHCFDLVVPPNPAAMQAAPLPAPIPMK